MDLGENPFDDLAGEDSEMMTQQQQTGMIDFDSSATFTMEDAGEEAVGLYGGGGMDGIVDLSPSPEQSVRNNNNPGSDSQGARGGGLLGSMTPSCCTLGYYQTYFDLTTEQAKDRLLRAYVPGSYRRPFFATEHPDFYVPFWMATTLVLVTTMTGNLAAWLQSGGSSTDENGQEYWEEAWNADFVTLYKAAALFYLYVSAVPVMVSLGLGWAGSARPFSFVISVYGYAMAVFLPVCFFCTVSAGWLRWLLLSYACLSSSFFLVRNLAEGHLITSWAAAEGLVDATEEPREQSAKEQAAGKAVMLLIVGLQVLFACALKFFFYP
jgi:hypothetical protein